MLKRAVLRTARRIVRRHAIRRLQGEPGLWDALVAYRKQSPSTGCSWTDLWTLYRTVRASRPTEILELGPGLSTVALAYAVMQNAREGCLARITGIEESDFYLEASRKLLPVDLSAFVELRLSPRVERAFGLFRGVGYRDVPRRPYDFVFVDGPHHEAPSDGAFLFDIDFIDVVQVSANSVRGIVDYRLSSCFVFQQVLGLRLARFDAIRELGFLGPCTKEDLLQLNLTDLTETLMRDARLIGSTALRLR